MKDLIIIGAGPAGISAAIYVASAGFETLILSKDAGALSKAANIVNYYGFPDGVSGAELQARGVVQAANLGAEFSDGEVYSIEPAEEGFAVVCADRLHSARAVLIATGASRATIKAAGVDRFEGSGISYCAVCDGFFFRGKKTALIGGGKYAEHELGQLSNFTSDIAVLTDGKELEFDAGDHAVDRRKIAAFEGGEKLEKIRFEDGGELLADGAFIALGSAGAVDLARKIGVSTAGRKIKTGYGGATSVKGIFAAGDCAEDFLQVSVAVGAGAKAAREITNYLKALKKN